MNWLKEAARRVREELGERARAGDEAAPAVEFFRSFLPARYNVARGEVAACNDEGELLLSDELEAVIYDQLHNPPAPGRVYPVESVYAAVASGMDMDEKGAHAALARLASARALGRWRTLASVAVEGVQGKTARTVAERASLSCRAFVVAYGHSLGKSSEAAPLLARLLEETEGVGPPHFHAFLALSADEEETWCLVVRPFSRANHGSYDVIDAPGDPVEAFICQVFDSLLSFPMGPPYARRYSGAREPFSATAEDLERLSKLVTERWKGPGAVETIREERGGGD